MTTTIKTLEKGWADAVKKTYATRRVQWNRAALLATGQVKPNPGDLVLCTVDELGQHTCLELMDGRRAHLLYRDRIVAVYGNRCSVNEFEALVPERLESCHLAASCGIAARVTGRHLRMRPPTTLTPLGLICDSCGTPLNISRFALAPGKSVCSRPSIIAVMGTSMHTGKNMTTASIIKGFVNAGISVGAAKITGSGTGRNYWLFQDAGADAVCDLIDAGVVSTHGMEPEKIEKIFHDLLTHLLSADVGVIVLEIAGNLYQSEVNSLCTSATFQQNIDGVVFVTGDAMGAAQGVMELHQHGFNVHALGGKLACSPLAALEAEKATGLRVFSRDDFLNGALLPCLTRPPMFSEYGAQQAPVGAQS